VDDSPSRLFSEPNAGHKLALNLMDLDQHTHRDQLIQPDGQEPHGTSETIVVGELESPGTDCANRHGYDATRLAFSILKPTHLKERVSNKSRAVDNHESAMGMDVGPPPARRSDNVHEPSSPTTHTSVSRDKAANSRPSTSLSAKPVPSTPSAKNGHPTKSSPTTVRSKACSDCRRSKVCIIPRLPCHVIHRLLNFRCFLLCSYHALVSWH
jgi:hypothetical protein